jgi:hypothetical protein
MQSKSAKKKGQRLADRFRVEHGMTGGIWDLRFSIDFEIATACEAGLAMTSLMDSCLRGNDNPLGKPGG